MLYNHTLPPNGGGDTLFASMYAAYENLSDRMKVYLDGLTALHDGVPTFVKEHPRRFTRLSCGTQKAGESYCT